MGAAVEHVGYSAAVGAAARCVAARRRSLANGTTIGCVAADRAEVRVAICAVDAVAVGDDSAWLQAGARVSASEALRKTRHVCERARAAANANATVFGTDS